MKPPPVLLLVVTLPLLLLAPTSASAQSKAALAEYEAAYDLFSAGDHQAAAKAYEEVIRGYPTDILVQSATVQLAFCQFFLAEFDQALANLDKALSGPPLQPGQQEFVDNLRPQILAAKAASLKPDDPARKGVFEDAIKAYGAFIEKHPKSREIEAAIYGRAMCRYQIGEYQAAIDDLRESVERFGGSSTIPASRNLLAIALATQGGAELGKDGGDKERAFGLLREAEEILRGIAGDKNDIVLFNDVNFQLGEILFMRAVNSPPDEKDAVYAEAIATYNAVLPKEEVIALQEEKIDSFAARKRQALRNRDIALKEQLDRDNERELKKLAELRGKPDQTALALLKLGEIHYNAGRHNAARTVLRHVTPFLENEDAQMRAAYFQTATYALQGVPDRAVDSYDRFQQAHKGVPLAENLPFLMGTMFLAANDAAGAVPYFEESLAIYPEGRLAGLSVAQKAQAQVALKQYDEALKTFEGSLAGNPSPEVAVVARSGIANIRRDTGKWDEAIAAYGEVKSNHPDTPQAVEADYWIAACTQQKGDNGAAIPMLEAFLAANDNHPLSPLATFALGSAQLSTGAKEAGLATLALLPEKFPDSPPAPFSYFTRAQVHAGDQNVDEINRLMREFIERYPQDDKVYFAYNSIAQNQVNKLDLDGAIATYGEFASNHSAHPEAAGALVKAADLQRTKAERIATNYQSLGAEEQEAWRAAVEASVATLEELLQKYPDSPATPAGLQSLLAAQRLIVRADLSDGQQVEAYFRGLADGAGDPGARSRILFALASFLSTGDKPAALAFMREAYDPSVVYASDNLDIFGLALIEGGMVDEAEGVFNKLAADYPVPAGTLANAAPPDIQKAQAVALFGLGRVEQERGRTTEAGALFERLKTDYPWSPKVLEADYGIAQSLHAQGKGDEAMPLLGGIIRAQNATAELRADAFLLYGQITKDKLPGAQTDEERKDILGAAIDYYLKIPQFYSGVAEAAAEGLWQGGQLVEMQLPLLTEETTPQRSKQLEVARNAYRQLVEEFGDSPHAGPAKERLGALPQQ
jgi:TolA-binding protein